MERDDMRPCSENDPQWISKTRYSKEYHRLRKAKGGALRAKRQKTSRDRTPSRTKE